MKAIKKLLFIILAALMLFPCISLSTETTAQAGTQTFNLPVIVRETPINFINGSFQTPEATTVWSPDGRIYDSFYPEDVPGWSSVPVDYATYGSDYSYYRLDFLKVMPNGESGYAKAEADGDQYCELNSWCPLRIYQNVATVPGTKLYWQFAHRARACSDYGTNFDITNLYIRPAGIPLSTPTSAQLIRTAGDNALDWYYYRGVYIVPAGQTATEFDLASIYTATGNPSLGNFVDDVCFQTPSSLTNSSWIYTSAADDSTALKGEIVTIHMTVTNIGETDASRCVLRNVLSDEVEYIEGSAKIAGVDAGSLATFNSATDELRINFGTGATAGTAATNGGILAGSISTGTSGTTGQGQRILISYQVKVTGDVGDIVKNQASITYNDQDFESFNSSDITCYSHVMGQTPASGVETTYVNQFTIVDRSTNGRVWYDTDGDGMIDAGETRASGLTVGLYQNGDTTYTTPVNDINGDPLVTTTNANGEYSFIALPAGTYKVVVTTPDGYKVTVKTVSTDNDAVASGTRALVSDINLNAVLSTTNLQDSITNADIGFSSMRTITLSKLVEGTLGDPDQDFIFRIYLTGVTGSLPYTGASTVTGVSAPADGTISNGGTVTLKHGQSITIEDVPTGTVYTIIETNGAGYTTTITDSNASGTVSDDVDVEFINTKNEVIPTGVLMDILPYAMIVALAICIVVVFLIIRRKRKQQERKRLERDYSFGRDDYRGL